MTYSIQSGIPTYVDACYSAGSGAYGNRYLYLRPNFECFNKSRRVGGYKDEVLSKAEKVIRKWYYPSIHLYSIDGHAIASNCPENALKEYWRVCDYNKRNIKFDVTLLTKTSAEG